MRRLCYFGAAAVALAMSANSGNAMSINLGAGLKPALDATDLVQKTAVFIVEGYRYCFYFNGCHGPGWYRCGFAWRRNLGWGGEYGWQSWSYGPAERRYGHGGRDRGAIEGPGKNVEGGTTIRRAPPVAGSKGGAEINGGGQMQKNTAPVGRGQMQKNAAPAGGNHGGGEGRGEGGGQGGGPGGGQGGGPGGGQGGGGEKR